MDRGRIGLAVSALVLMLGRTAGGAGDLLIRNTRLLDGTGAPPRPATSIVIRNGRIAAIGTAVDAPGVPVLDVAGATVLPGLIDAHVHLGVVPGAVQRGDSPETQRTLRRRHLRAYLACGITTVLDASVPAEVAREIQAWLGAGEPGPRYLTLGPGLTVPGGYLADSTEPVATAADVAARVALLRSLGAVGVKVFIERGFTPWPMWPIHAPEVRGAIVSEAAKAGLPIYVHANREEDKEVALDMGARAIVHTGYYNATPSEEFVRRLASSRTYLMTTCAIADVDRFRFHPERLNDALLRQVVPAAELATARDPAAADLLLRMQIGMALPWLPTALQRPVGRVVLGERRAEGAVRSCQAAVRRFWEAGVPIVAASDSGNWPVVPWQFHGPTTLREIELVGDAGLPPMAALLAATRVPARLLQLEDEIGTVAVGKRADLVIVREDPLRDLRNLRTVAWTVKDGVARTPAEWLE